MDNETKFTSSKKNSENDIKSLNNTLNKPPIQKSLSKVKSFAEVDCSSFKNNILESFNDNFKSSKTNCNLNLNTLKKDSDELIITKKKNYYKSSKDVNPAKISKNIKHKLLKMTKIIKPKIKLKINKSLTFKRRGSAPFSHSLSKMYSLYISNKKMLKKTKSRTPKNFNSSKKLLIPKHEQKYRCLNQKNILYDSLDDNELDDEDDDNIIEMGSLFISIYDIFLTFCSYYCLLFIPIVLAKSDCFCKKIIFFQKILNYFTDIIYIIDIILSSFRSYYNYEMKLINNNKKIIRNYIRTDLFFDLIESIPVFSISEYICSKKINFMCEQYSMPVNDILLKIASILKIFKTFKVNNHRKNRVAEYFQNSIYFENAFHLFKNFFIYILFLHLLICVHIFLGIQRYPNWILLTNTIDDGLSSKYISSFYFMITTMTTVGYGDILCVSFIERIFQIILLTIGTILYSFLISKVGNYIRDQSHLQAKLEQDKAILEEIRLAYPEMSFKLYSKINKYLTSKFTKSKKSENSILINSLPETIKYTIVFKVHQKTIQNFKFFKKCHNSQFIMEALSYFDQVIYKKGDILIKEGQIINNITFVKDGRLSLEASVDLEDPVTSIENYLTKNFKDISKEEDKIRQMENNKFENTVVSINPELSLDDLQKKINTLIFDNNKKTDTSLSEFESSEKLNSTDILDTSKDMINEDIFNNNFQHLKILDIRKNEHFGDVYVFLQKPAPLSLKVKSKISEIYLLQKNNAMALNQSYPNIWRKIQNRSYHNLISIKYRTFKILKSFCENQIQLSQKQFSNLYNIMTNGTIVPAQVKTSFITYKTNLKNTLKIFQNVAAKRFKTKGFVGFRKESNFVSKRASAMFNFSGNKVCSSFIKNINNKNNMKINQIKKPSIALKFGFRKNSACLSPPLKKKEVPKLFNEILSNGKKLNKFYDNPSTKSYQKLSSITSLRVLNKINNSMCSDNKRKLSENKSPERKSIQNSQFNETLQDIEKRCSFIESSIRNSCINFINENKKQIFDNNTLQSSFCESFEIKSSYQNVNLLSNEKLINNEIYQKEFNELIEKFFSNKKSNKTVNRKNFSFQTFEQSNTLKKDEKKISSKDNLDSSSEIGTLRNSAKVLKLAVYDNKERTLQKLKVNEKKINNGSENMLKQHTIAYSLDSKKDSEKNLLKSLFNANKKKDIDNDDKIYISILRNKTYSVFKKKENLEIDRKTKKDLYINLNKFKLSDKG